MATSQLSFDILAKDNASAKLSKIGKGFDNLHSGAKHAEGGVGRLAGKLGGVLGGALKGGVIGVGLLGAGLVSLAPTIVSSAANLELMGRKSARVFGDQLPKVQAWADKGAHAMGLTKKEAVGLAAGMADLLVPMGFTRSAAADMSTKVIGLSGALSEWSGGTKSAAEVSDILNAALLGERDSLQQLGIGISQAQVDAQVLANKKKGLKFATQEQAEAQATLDLIMDKSKDAQAAYATGAGTLARKVQEGKARLKEMGETLLITALPALTKIADLVAQYVLPKLETFVNWVANDGKYAIAQSFIDMSKSVLTFARTAVDKMLGVAESIVHVGEILAVFSPATAVALRGAKTELAKFRAKAAEEFGAAEGEIHSWDVALGKMRKEAKIKADIKDLQGKLATAKNELKNPNLTKERKAKINADIKALEAKLRTAQGKLNALHGKTVYVNVFTRMLGPTIPDLSVGVRAPGRQHGGPVRAGMPYWVGERRPELFVPDRSGRIIPDDVRSSHGAASTAAATVQRIELVVRSSGTAADHAIAGLIRRFVKVNGGGNVQKALGQ